MDSALEILGVPATLLLLLWPGLILLCIYNCGKQSLLILLSGVFCCKMRKVLIFQGWCTLSWFTVTAVSLFLVIRSLLLSSQGSLLEKRMLGCCLCLFWKICWSTFYSLLLFLAWRNQFQISVEFAAFLVLSLAALQRLLIAVFVNLPTQILRLPLHSACLFCQAAGILLGSEFC